MKKFARILVCALLLVSLLAGCGKSSKFNSLAKKYEAVKNGDFSAYEELTPEAYWEYMKDEMDMDADDVIERREESFEGTKDYDGTADENEEAYGKNWKIKVEVVDEKKVDAEKLEEIADSLDDNYEIKSSEVTEAYKVFFKQNIKGDDDRDMWITELHAVKISGDWYLCNVYETEDEDGKEKTSVSFVFG